MSTLQYNTSRKYLGLREYGRHIQKMVDYLLTLEDRDKRNQQAKAVIELMGFLNPHLRNVEDFRHMLWDHLFAISDFTLDVDSPYPIPQKETYKLQGEPMKYPRRYPKYAHLGKNLELVIDKALHEQDQEKKVEFANSIAYYMKLTYSNWHKEMVHDDSIRTELNLMTNGELEFKSTPNIRHNRSSSFEIDEYGRNAANRKSASNGNRGGIDSRSNRGSSRPGTSRDGNKGGGGSSFKGTGRPSSALRDDRVSPSRNFKKRF